jgi:prepilin-type N-terminal cleavage/methylation domain-containing protein
VTRIKIGRRGFTMIEMILFIILLAIAAAFLAPFSTGLRGSPDPVLMQQAVALVQDRLEQIVADRRDTTTPRGYTYATNPANYPAETPVTGYANFNRAVAIACVTTADLNAAGSSPAPSCNGVTDHARITVTVTNAKIGSVSAATLASNY